MANIFEDINFVMYGHLLLVKPEGRELWQVTTAGQVIWYKTFDIITVVLTFCIYQVHEEGTVFNV